ncbi:AAA family ATPase [Halorubrum sp. JWXQ-INN 858]|uniref:adenylate kinase family protein n=1 Tax=Halorubrum sp. JWXQ-INN 858 TaxID=2690782 RepID=UPI0013FA4BB6|nr:adenylate kinase family protein [Halorubrum sp. JWXQ-INN 858]MWV65610.1 AAA family ATPase [Halorubrum sp. JWXQ-INN 858]
MAAGSNGPARSGGADGQDRSGERADRVAVTGTPGTGKSTATALLADEYAVTHLNELIKGDDDLWTERDEGRDTLVADLDAVAERLGDWSGIVDSHLAHRLEADRVVVLRCRPERLERRLRDRGEPAAKAQENAESEALDVILSEAVTAHGTERVYEIDTTDLDPAAVADAIRAVVEGTRDPSAGVVDFLDYL